MQEGKMPDFNVIKIGCIVVILLVLLIAAVIITVKEKKVREKYAGCVMQRKFSF